MIIVSLKNVPKEQQHDHAHSLLRVCLKSRGIDYSADTPVTKGIHGKPFLTEHPEICYNLSHSDGIAACIMSEYECGIDCEAVVQYRPNVIRRAFSEDEISLIENAPEEERDLLFFRIWTLKESYVKATGQGLTCPLKSLSFSFEGSRIISDITGFRFKQYCPKDGKYVVSICKNMNKM